MNVSSVKNLNGEVLSAVQDASLTNVIQTNSGNWQDITAYQNASATYLTGVSIPESATWNEVSTTVQSNSAQWAEGGGSTGTMNVSGLEYNAVNEISAYNGSAISQYGAEKQWLVHDDTLVHAANSAQYALGVAIDNVARLMGVDETELLSSTANSAFTLTEPFSSFEQVKIKLRWWDKVPDNYYNVERFTNNKCSLSWTYFDNITDGGPLELVGASWTSNNGIGYNLEGGFARTFAITATGMGYFTITPYPLSIIGIGRKA